MNNVLYSIAVVLTILWLVGHLGYNVSGIIHVRILIGVVAVLLRVIGGNRNIKKKNTSLKIEKPDR